MSKRLSTELGPGAGAEFIGHLFDRVPDMSLDSRSPSDVSVYRASVVIESVEVAFHRGFVAFVESKLQGRQPLSTLDHDRLTVRFGVKDCSEGTWQAVDDFASGLVHCVGDNRVEWRIEIWDVDFRSVSDAIARRALLQLSTARLREG